jgi:hypothetical protein
LRRLAREDPEIDLLNTRKFWATAAFGARKEIFRSGPMTTKQLSSDELRALARMARGGVFVDHDGRGILAGRAVIERGTVRALEHADLIKVEEPAGVPKLTGAGRAVLLLRSPSAD